MLERKEVFKMIHNKKIGELLSKLRKEKRTYAVRPSKPNFLFPIRSYQNGNQGESLPDASTLLILSKFYNVSIEQIFVGQSSYSLTK